MNSTQDKVSLIQILGVVIPVISIFISHYLGIRIFDFKYSKKVLQKRYMSFYAPFIKLLYQKFAYDILPHQYDTNDLTEFMDLINDNLHYLDINSLNHYTALYYSFGVLNTDKNSNKFKEQFDDQFILFSIAVLEESITVSNELKLPPLAVPFLEILSHKSAK